MRDNYDFSKAKRAKHVTHLARLQAEAAGKQRITIMLDSDLIATFRTHAKAEGIGYQTLINQTLRQSLRGHPVDEATLRKVLREELQGSEDQD
ncbi:MAG: BrnA antitoxin family protein [Gammaproteobacteria bacterium]|nr:BrnA antitoxin family protein [Gammaproteobacteria bacterium]